MMCIVLPILIAAIACGEVHSPSHPPAAGVDARQSPVPPPPPPPPAAEQDDVRKEKLVIAGEAFELEVAADDESRAQGLMDRDKIDDHGGMLFIYPWPQTLGFWMKNCLIEMDILFVNDKGVITATHRMKPPPPRRPSQSEIDYDNALPRYESRKPAQFAIELKAGTVERLKITPGDKIEMDVERLEKLARSSMFDDA